LSLRDILNSSVVCRALIGLGRINSDPLFLSDSLPERFFSDLPCANLLPLRVRVSMQGAQASCNPEGLPLTDGFPPSIPLPRRPSFSLELFDRFAQNNDAITIPALSNEMLLQFLPYLPKIHHLHI